MPPARIGQRLVSTHSRLKAAGGLDYARFLRDKSFNTQPPEGGWLGWQPAWFAEIVSTHSRLKAAG